MVHAYLSLCAEINFPLSEEKTAWATQIIIFLGMLLNTVTQTISIPVEKRNKALKQLWDLMTSRKTTVLKLQKLTGLLNNISKALVPGRAFNRQFYLKCAGQKLHHHIRVDNEIKLDAAMWIKFLRNDGLCCQFIDFELTLKADEINWYTDASGTIGLDGIINQHWFHAVWSKSFLKNCRPSIEFQELYAQSSHGPTYSKIDVWLFSVTIYPSFLSLMRLPAVA